MNWKTLFFIALVASGGYYTWHKSAVSYPPGVIAPAEPIQTNPDNSSVFSKNGYQIEPLANFEVEARVLAAEHYHVGKIADLIPVDLALGWGRMSDESILKDIKISQSDCFYFWHVDNFMIPREEIETHSANMHMISSSDAIEKTLSNVRVGQVVKITGYLVEATSVEGMHWRSSLTRNDTGAGACETIFVKSVTVC